MSTTLINADQNAFHHETASSCSPWLQIVREKLVSLEIPFIQHTTVRGSPKRQLLADKYGKFAVPYLEVAHLPQPFVCPHVTNQRLLAFYAPVSCICSCCVAAPATMVHQSQIGSMLHCLHQQAMYTTSRSSWTLQANGSSTMQPHLWASACCSQLPKVSCQSWPSIAGLPSCHHT